MSRFPSKEEAELAFEYERQKRAQSHDKSRKKAFVFGRLVHSLLILAICAGVVVFWTVMIDLVGEVISPETLSGENKTMAGIWLGILLAYLMASVACIISFWRNRPTK